MLVRVLRRKCICIG